MKTQQELMQAYWGPGGTVDMVKEYNAKHGCDVKPWKCVKNSLIHMGYKEHPTFIDRASCYTFALTILYDNKRKEHRPVFVYDRLWNGQHWVVIEIDLYVDNLSWNPPKPKRTLDESALNEAGWKFIESYRKIIGQEETSQLFNNIKPILRDTIDSYLTSRDKE